MQPKGFVFNNIRKPHIHMLRGRQKSPFFPLEREFVQYSRGWRLKKTKRGLLEISQPIAYRADNDVEALAIKDELAVWLITDDWATLQFDDEPGRTYQAVVQNGIDDFEKISRLRQGTINFVARSAEGQTKTLSLTTTLKDFAITGQIETPWSSYTKFTAAASRYTLETDKHKITLNHNFIVNDVLEIEYKKRKVTLNGNPLPTSISLDSHWFILKSGTMKLRSSHATTLTYKEKYH